MQMPMLMSMAAAEISLVVAFLFHYLIFDLDVADPLVQPHITLDFEWRGLATRLLMPNRQ
jgi:hypothetical protein